MVFVSQRNGIIHILPVRARHDYLVELARVETMHTEVLL